MKAFRALFVASVTMLRRNRVLLITSLGLALLSIFVFGWLFGGGGTPKLELGVVDLDASTLSQQMTRGCAPVTRSRSSLAARRRSYRRYAMATATPSLCWTRLRAGAGAGQRHQHPGLLRREQPGDGGQRAHGGADHRHQPQPAGDAPDIAHHAEEQAVSVHNLRQIDWLTPGMLGMLLMWANLSVGVALVEWREQGVLRRLAVTPLRPGVLISTQMLARLALSLLQGAALILVAMLVFHVQVTGSWIALGVTVARGAGAAGAWLCGGQLCQYARGRQCGVLPHQLPDDVSQRLLLPDG